MAAGFLDVAVPGMGHPRIELLRPVPLALPALPAPEPLELPAPAATQAAELTAQQGKESLDTLWNCSLVSLSTAFQLCLQLVRRNASWCKLWEKAELYRGLARIAAFRHSKTSCRTC